MEKRENEKIVTKEEAIERIDENLTEIDSAYGKIRVSKTFFKVCAAIGAGAAVVGGIGIGVLGFVLAPVATTGLGVAAFATSLAFHRGENKELARMQEAEERNMQTYTGIKVKEVMKEQEKAKVLAKQPVNEVVSRTR